MHQPDVFWEPRGLKVVEEGSGLWVTSTHSLQMPQNLMIILADLFRSPFHFN